MKKLLLIFFPFLLLVPLYSKSNNHNKIVVAINRLTDSIEITLNGIKKDNALEMMNYYMKNRGADTKPTRQSIWFDSLTVHRIVRLLSKEIHNDSLLYPHRKDFIDGIRIYFVSDPSVTTPPFNNSIILVSTRYGGPNPNIKGENYHTDYYTHAKNDSLFNETNETILGSRMIKKFIRKGDRLYSTCWFCSTNQSCSPKDIHYLERKKAEKMVHQFGKDTIKTNGEWFDLDLFNAFAHAKQVDGIRIYFSKHGVDADTTVSLKHAFIMIPTVYSKFYKTHKDNFNCEITNNYFITFKKKYALKATLLATYNVAGGQDNGELCPDNCNK